MIRRIGKVTYTSIVVLSFVFLLCLFLQVVLAVPISGTLEARLGSFTGPIGGTAQDDNVKASLDLAHTDLDAILADTGTTLDERVLALLGSGTGSVWYCDSGETSGTEDGTTWATATDTLDEAVNLCTANVGDIILVAPGHAENLSGADGVDVDVAGITIIGLGNGQLRPTFSYTNGAGEFVLGANGDNSRISNLRFVATVDSVVHAIDVEAGCVGWQIDNCEFKAETTTTDEFDDVITIGAAADEGYIYKCRFLGDPGSNADPQSCINFVDCDYLVVRQCEFFGDRAVACIQNETTASNFILLENNTLFNGIIGGSAGLNAQPVIELVATTTGVIRHNIMACNLATVAAAIVGDDMFTYENYYNEDDGGDADAIVTGAAASVTQTADD